MVSTGHTPVSLKPAVIFPWVNERSKASLIIPGRLCIEIFCPALFNSKLFCFVLLRLWMALSLLYPVAGVGEFSEVGRYTWQCHSLCNKVTYQAYNGPCDCPEVPGSVLRYSGYFSLCAPTYLTIKDPCSSHLLGNWLKQGFPLVHWSPKHHAF